MVDAVRKSLICLINKDASPVCAFRMLSAIRTLRRRSVLSYRLTG